ncbi:MAG: hypothetical protein ABIR53_07545, partial [Paraperlucidibaca sp.]
MDAITPSQVTIYIAALEPLPANTLRQRQKAQILAWLSEHDDNTDTSSACTAITQTRELALTTTDLGKPYWPNSPWLLNWSHSRHYLAL